MFDFTSYFKTEEFNSGAKRISIPFIKQFCRDIPKDGIMLKDLTLCLSNKDCFHILINLFEQQIMEFDFDYLIGVDARGFIFSSALADRLNKGFVYVRKKGKLPGETISYRYKTEYSVDEIEIDKESIKPGSKLVFVDDVYATGGTAYATTKLVQELDSEIIQYMFVWDLRYVNKTFEIPEDKLFSIMVEE